MDISSDKRNLTRENMDMARRETESLLLSAQNISIRINYVKARIDKTQQNSRCRLCCDSDEMIYHIISDAVN